MDQRSKPEAFQNRGDEVEIIGIQRDTYTPQLISSNSCTCFSAHIGPLYMLHRVEKVRGRESARERDEAMKRQPIVLTENTGRNGHRPGETEKEINDRGHKVHLQEATPTDGHLSALSGYDQHEVSVEIGNGIHVSVNLCSNTSKVFHRQGGSSP